MGFAEWMLLRGPGGPGATAKVMMISYHTCNEKHRQASREDLLLMTLKLRYRSLDDLSALEIIRQSGGTLTGLVTYVWFKDTPAAAYNMKVRPEAERIVAEACARGAPGA